MLVTRPTAPVLVGREHAVATLRSQVARTRDSHGGLVLVTGEPGIGKTTLVTEALRHADDPEVIVVAGAAWDGEGAPGYWPWTQVLRALRHHLDPAIWEQAATASGEGLQAVVGDGPPPARDLSDALRFRTNDAVATLLVTASRHRPVVVLLDDLHWADVASLELLEFLVRHAWFERVLVIGTVRDVDVGTDGAEDPGVARVERLAPKATTIALAGLERAEVATLLAQLSGETVSDEVAHDVHRRTGGNPFFVQELASLWRGGTLPDTVPPGVEAVVQARVAQLPDEVGDLLATAAVIGREFDHGLLARATDREVGDVAGLLGRASSAQLLEPRGRDRSAFRHDLVRATLLAGLLPDDRRRAHAAVVAALEAVEPGDARAVASERAEHAYLAVPHVAPERALSLLLAAADEACGRLASHELVAHLERALELVPPDQPDRRASVALDLGDALHGAGRLAEARTVFEREVVLARERGTPDLLARAVLGLHALGLPDPDEDWRREVDLLDEALAGLEAAGDATAAGLHLRVLAASGQVRAHRTDGDPVAEERTVRAVRLATESGDDAALGAALLARHDVVWKPGTAPERLALAEQLEQVGDRLGDRAVSLQGLMLRTVALLEQGDPLALDLHRELVRRVERSGLPRYRFLARSRAGAFATLRGEFDDARAAIDGALALGERLDEVDRHRLWLEQRWALALRRGDGDEADALVQRYHDHAGTYAEVTFAVTMAANGHRAADRERLVRAFGRVDELANEYPGMFGASMLHAKARLAIAAGDPRLAARVRADLAPLRGSWAVVAGGGAVYGPYALLLGELAVVEGRVDDAIADLEQAVTEAERLGARPWAVDARLAAGRARLSRGATDDARIGGALLERARDDAAALGLEHLVAEAERYASGAGGTGAGETGAGGTAAGGAGAADAGGTASAGPTSTDDPRGARPDDDRRDDQRVVSRFEPDGEVWTLSFAGRTVRVPATKGLKDLHVLLGLPGAEVPATELLDPEGGEVVRAAKRLGGDPVLDAEARETYRRRLTDLDTLIDRATARHDDEKAARLDQEREALLDELRRATGIGGRPRRLGDEAERARKTVTARIRDTMRRLDEQHPELAEHLRASIATGATCRYRPTREVDWQL